jgi:hypothetical protein
MNHQLIHSILLKLLVLSILGVICLIELTSL